MQLGHFGIVLMVVVESKKNSRHHGMCHLVPCKQTHKHTMRGLTGWRRVEIGGGDATSAVWLTWEGAFEVVHGVASVKRRWTSQWSQRPGKAPEKFAMKSPMRWESSAVETFFLPRPKVSPLWSSKSCRIYTSCCGEVMLCVFFLRVLPGRMKKLLESVSAFEMCSSACVSAWVDNLFSKWFFWMSGEMRTHVQETQGSLW